MNQYKSGVMILFCKVLWEGAITLENNWGIHTRLPGQKLLCHNLFKIFHLRIEFIICKFIYNIFMSLYLLYIHFECLIIHLIILVFCFVLVWFIDIFIENIPKNIKNTKTLTLFVYLYRFLPFYKARSTSVRIVFTHKMDS